MRRFIARILLLLVALPAIALAGGVPADIDFLPDPGVRVQDANIPWAVVTSSGKVRLYVDSHGKKYAKSSDGLDFRNFKKARDKDPYDPTRVKLHNGKWRRYYWEDDGRLTSEKSRDGVNFRKECGKRYKLRSADNNSPGYFDIYKTKKKKKMVVMLYIGDMKGVNNVRMAVSKNNGRTFKFKKGNPLGDKDAGGSPNTYVDQRSIKLTDGRRRLFTMKDGEIFSFTSDDGGLSYERDPGPILRPSDFKGMGITTLHDPSVVTLDDGRYRMYVAGAIGKGQDREWVIVSATSRGTTN